MADGHLFAICAVIIAVHGPGLPDILLHGADLLAVE